MGKTTEARRKEDERLALLIQNAREKVAQRALQAEKLKQEQEKIETERETRVILEDDLEAREIERAEAEGFVQQTSYFENLEHEHKRIRQHEGQQLVVQGNKEQFSPLSTSKESIQDFLPIPFQKKPYVANVRQQEAADLAISGASFCLIGPAGTGKTTCVKHFVPLMMRAGLIGPLRQSTKWLQAGLPGVAIMSFTNKAVANIAKGMPADITCVTAHKIIEFEPVFYDAINAAGEMVKTMRFEPARTKHNPLPKSLTVIIFEESASIPVALYNMIMDAIPHPVQVIFLGDIQQLAPVYGPAILGFKMLELPVVELTEVHRQALDSPILGCAWEMLDGKPMSAAHVKKKYDTPGKFLFRPWKIKMNWEGALDIAFRLTKQLLDADPPQLNVMEDMILLPYNKQFGTTDLNKNIAYHLGRKRKAEVHEIIAGWQKFYYALGDKVMVRKQEAIITKIVRNGRYSGTEPLSPSPQLNRWGHYDPLDAGEEKVEMSLEDFETMMAAATISSGEIEDKKNQASHLLTCKLVDADEEIEVQTTGDFMEMTFGYCLTIHKAQGSEWKKVLLFLHNSHKSLCRELLYTAVTRAKESLYIVGEPNTFEVGVTRQRIKGNTLAEKAEYFKGKLREILEDEDDNGKEG